MLYTSQSLPLSIMLLTDWQLIKVSGVDNGKFLQGQLTADMTKLTDSHFVFAAQCDPKGKVWSNMLLFKRGEDTYYIERASIVATQLKELKKYAVFSKVTLDIDTGLYIMGIAGNDIRLANIEALFNDEQNCVHANTITYLKIDFPQTRYIVIGTKADLEALDVVKNSIQQHNDQWALLDLQANYPIIDLPLANQYLPQAFNLQDFAAISFDKGCYCGQEMVARAQYRGINKRALYLLVGQGEQLPAIGDTLEQQMAENWRETGCVTAVLRVDDNTIWVQAILSSELEADAIFRIKNQPASKLSLSKPAQ